MNHANLRRSTALTTLALLALTYPAPSEARRSTPQSAEAPTLAPLDAELLRLTNGAAGTVGMTVVHLETGRRASLNPRVRFPMASTYKVAIAGAILDQVDAGKFTLDRMIPVPDAMIVDSDGISKDFPHADVSLSVINLIETMLVVSDNTATDVLMRLAGGPAAVTAWVNKVGVTDMRIDRDTAGLVKNFTGIDVQWTKKNFEALLLTNPELAKLEDAPNPRFDNDPRDTSTPDAMVHLLTKIHRGEALSVGSTKLLLEVMGRCVTGQNRLIAMLPPGVALAHKTGTIGGSVNDVGIMTLPNGGGHLAIAVYIKASSDPVSSREKLIAQMARTAFDYMQLAVAIMPHGSKTMR